MLEGLDKFLNGVGKKIIIEKNEPSQKVIIEHLAFSDEYFYEILAREIALTRNKRNISVEQLSVLCGVPPSEIKNIEGNIGEVNISSINKILVELKIRIKLIVEL
jgi:hypothetical protein